MSRLFESDGLITVCNGNLSIGDLYFAVEKRVNSKWQDLFQQIGAEPYDMPTFAFNVKCVNEDMDEGRIPEATTLQEWIDAIVAEYDANCQHGLMNLLSAYTGYNLTR